MQANRGPLRTAYRAETTGERGRFVTTLPRVHRAQRHPFATLALVGAHTAHSAAESDTVKFLFASLRAIAAIAIVVAITAQFVHTASLTTVNPFNFFGYFTNQSNIIAAIAFGASAIFIFAGRAQAQWVIYLRALATVVMAIVGIVYNTLLANAGLDDSFNLQWSNDILHVVIPLYAVLDWVLFGDRPKLPFARLWVMLIYPIIWLIVVLIRGATDGWVPYPFLDPATGYASVAVYCLIIAAVTILFGYGAYAVTRTKLIKP